MNPQLLKDLDWREVKAPVAAASNTDSNSDRIDTAGFEGVIFSVPIEDSAATGVAKMTIEQNSADSDTGMAALAGAVATATCVDNDDLNGKLLIVNVHLPRERFVQAVLYGSRKLPVTEHSTIADAASVTSPAEA